ncbi:MAG: glycoside hydrolase family 3 C-terminal domain-containing protein [Holdemanella sp.]|nr:glycoside hydrolase family 3 C-terminal domain-containing protein [Holdemanella sp.]
MSLKEKIALCSGENFWQTKSLENLPAVFMCDGPNGLRKQDLQKKTDAMGVNQSKKATCFPCSVTLSNSFDEELLYKVGQAIGQEANKEKVGMVLGPGCNIKRNPLCGRNFEYFSEDPYISGKLAASYIQGMEATGISCSLKHFFGNNQEYNRFTSNSVMDERTKREIYLKPFEIAVKEGKPSTVMCAYNKIDGIHCSDSKTLLTDILRKEWGFTGLVITDWGAMNDRIKSFEAGLDLSMPGGSAYQENDAYKALQEGNLDEGYIDASVSRVIHLMEKTKKSLSQTIDFKMEDHHALAIEAACKGAVLLKNENILPLQKDKKVAIIGTMAEYPRYQGAGSSHVNPDILVTPLDVFKGSYAKGYNEDGSTDKKLLEEAKQVASNKDICIIFAGLPEAYESEGFDRETMKMPEGMNQLIQEVSSVNENIVVILCAGAPVEIEFEEKVKAILYLGLAGQGIGQASYNLVYGLYNPSGKLSETWPKSYNDVISKNYYGTKDALYKEGIYVGYRYYEKANIPVRYPFGYGLSYTTFTYSNLEIKENTVSVTVTNNGNVAGDEIVLLYIGMNKKDIYRPVRELKRFKKIHLNVNESKTVTFALDTDCFEVYQDGFKVLKGNYFVQIDALKEFFDVDGFDFEIKSAPWYLTVKKEPSLHEFESLLGYSYKEEILKKGSFTMDNSVVEMKDSSLVMKIMHKAVEIVIAKGNGGKIDYTNPTFKMLMASSVGGPLRNMQISSGSKGNTFAGLLDMANGHFFKGLKKMMSK